MPTPNEYDISRAFQRIENDLMDSMMRNLKRHKAEETELGFNWEQWQALQLKELERYRAQNLDKFRKEFDRINRKIGALYRTTAADAQAQQEAFILDQIRKKDFRPTQNKDISFFGLNDDKLDILIARTQNDFTRAEYAVLRRADDIYRRTIFDAQVYANITNDYNKAVDMATHDFLKAGLQSVEYKNGARHNIAEYARMAIRTGNKRACLMGQGNAHDKYGLHTVRVNRRTQACPLCVGYLGRVLVDDVYGGGTAREAAQLGVPTLSSAMQAGFLHPNCKDIYSLYIEGISQPAKPWTKPEIEQIVGEYNTEQSLRHAADMAESYTRLAKYALDPGNAQKYQARADQWRSREADLKDQAEAARARGMNTGAVDSQEALVLKPETIMETLAGLQPLPPETNLDEVYKLVNPRYAQGPEYQMNCQRCVAAQELAFRGFDSVARPFADDAIGDDITKVWKIKGSLREDPEVAFLDPRHLDWDLESAFESWPADARAVVRLDWKDDKFSHFIFARKKNGRIILEDPQNGTLISINDLRGKLVPGNTGNWVMRVDNRDFTDNLYLAIESR